MLFMLISSSIFRLVSVEKHFHERTYLSAPARHAGKPTDSYRFAIIDKKKKNFCKNSPIALLSKQKYILCCGNFDFIGIFYDFKLRLKCFAEEFFFFSYHWYNFLKRILFEKTLIQIERINKLEKEWNFWFPRIFGWAWEKFFGKAFTGSFLEAHFQMIERTFCCTFKKTLFSALQCLSKCEIGRTAIAMRISVNFQLIVFHSFEAKSTEIIYFFKPKEEKI